MGPVLGEDHPLNVSNALGGVVFYTIMMFLSECVVLCMYVSLYMYVLYIHVCHKIVLASQLNNTLGRAYCECIILWEFYPLIIILSVSNRYLPIFATNNIYEAIMVANFTCLHTHLYLCYERHL